MIIFGIETSCDDCALAVVRNGREVLAQEIVSQTALHQRYGGIVPELAARQHVADIGALAEEVLTAAAINCDALDAIAVTQRPGLVGSLLVGASFAKGMAVALGLPLVAVNHVDAHIFGALLGLAPDAVKFPCLALVVSGGHTNLYRMQHLLDFKVIDYSLDDACGEAFDKVAKLLKLSSYSGVAVEQFAGQSQLAQSHSTSQTIPLALPAVMRGKNNFSYAGLKTAVANIIRAERLTADEQRSADLCYAFQEEAFAQLLDRLEMRCDATIKSLIVAGGVAANHRFRTLLRQHFDLPIYLPAPHFCTDNAAMIASLGYYLLQTERGDDLTWQVM
ncbi:MAG: tRNA (adenosine(37)-N6)-threonylcarbamoyltransferase complex transferase subunit TsaD [Pseudomonadota bacterium]|nr:tRNA (adenosine(37)-N6)-threonylcarbamoyltransferase complex transferase subunit TsaD [Pseudomonadota bacterium]